MGHVAVVTTASFRALCMVRMLTEGFPDFLVAVKAGGIGPCLVRHHVRGAGVVVHRMAVETGHGAFLETGGDGHAKVLPAPDADAAVFPESIVVRVRLRVHVSKKDKLVGLV